MGLGSTASAVAAAMALNNDSYMNDYFEILNVQVTESLPKIEGSSLEYPEVLVLVKFTIIVTNSNSNMFA